MKKIGGFGASDPRPSPLPRPLPRLPGGRPRRFFPVVEASVLVGGAVDGLGSVGVDWLRGTDGMVWL